MRLASYVEIRLCHIQRIWLVDCSNTARIVRAELRKVDSLSVESWRNWLKCAFARVVFLRGQLSSSLVPGTYIEALLELWIIFLSFFVQADRSPVPVTPDYSPPITRSRSAEILRKSTRLELLTDGKQQIRRSKRLVEKHKTFRIIDGDTAPFESYKPLLKKDTKNPTSLGVIYIHSLYFTLISFCWGRSTPPSLDTPIHRIHLMSWKQTI